MIHRVLFVSIVILTVMANAIASPQQSLTASGEVQQTTGTTASTATFSLPRLIAFNGIAQSRTGVLSGVMSLTFALYRDQVGGAPLWIETQNAQLDTQGRYNVLLGVTQARGLPMDLFVSGETRWLGVRVQMPGEEEQSRILLASVPYALKAADADTIGGMPASAFVLAQPGSASNSPKASDNLPKTTDESVTLTPTVRTFADAVTTPFTFVNASNNVGIGTTTPGYLLTVQSADSGTGLATGDFVQIANTNSSLNTKAGIAFATDLAKGSASSLIWSQLNNVATGASSLNFSTFDGSTWHDPAATIAGNGNVGIGTTTPGTALEVNGYISGKSATGAQFITSQTGGGNGVGVGYELIGTSHADWLFYTNNSAVTGLQDSLAFYKNAGTVGTKLVIQDNGNVGIGTTNPTTKLDVAGDLKVEGGGIISGNGSGLTNLLASNLTGTLPNNQTTAVSSNSPNTLVLRDGSGNFSANAVTATSFSGNGSALTNVNANSLGGSPAASFQTRGITYLGGCDTCSALADTDDQRTIYFNVVGAMTINSVTCFSDAGTPIINLQRDTGLAQANVLALDLTCSTTGATSTNIVALQSILNLNDKLDFVMVTAGGTAKRVTVAIKTTVN